MARSAATGAGAGSASKEHPCRTISASHPGHEARGRWDARRVDFRFVFRESVSPFHAEFSVPSVLCVLSQSEPGGDARLKSVGRWDARSVLLAEILIDENRRAGSVVEPWPNVRRGLAAA